MSDQPPASAPTDAPDLHQDRPVGGAEAPTRTGRLLGLVHKLIDYGKDLANALQQRTAATNLVLVTLAFGTQDIALILARITRGLLRAAALEARITSGIAEQEKRPAAASNKPPRQPRIVRPVDRQAKAAEDPSLARLPTPAAIAAEVRRRPIGAVLADICRDLGILPSHPLWRDLNQAIMQNGGNASALLLDAFKLGRDQTADTRSIIPPMPPGWRPPPGQSFPPMPPGWQSPARPQPPAASGTGPPEPAASTTSKA
ncbi:MAG TPA: hypothetical protein VGL95_06395 [Acetobacteraceae bacterium]